MDLRLALASLRLTLILVVAIGAALQERESALTTWGRA